jgi:phenylacetate-CoA ligase
MALQFQLERSQWYPADCLLQLQMRQLHKLLQHASTTVPYYREQLQAAEIDLSTPLTMDSWRRLPLLKRDVIQHRGEELLSDQVPAHGEVFEKKTSGSTGRQLRISDTDASHLYWMGVTLRDHLWHHRDFSGRLVCIRSGRSGKDPMTVRHADSWGPSSGSVFQTGPSTVLYHTMPIERQVEVLQQLQPAYLLLYPSNAIRLADYFRTQQLTLPSLLGVQTYGELLWPEVREDCWKTWGVAVTDIYSCEETGYIALQCPEFEHHHCPPA